MVICLLLLAAGLRPWKGLGLEFLLVLSIPIDIWALGLCGRTVLLERLNIDPQSGLGKRLWWKWAVFSVIYLPILYFTVSFVTSISKSVTASIIETIEANVWVIPVAEQITIELVMWGSVAGAVLVLLMIGWFYGLGALAQGEVKSAKSKDGNFEQIVYFWDKIRIPADQVLLLTSFTLVGVVLVLLFWVLLPETTPHPHDEYVYSYVVEVEQPVKPLEVLANTEKVLKKAELTIVELEKEQDASGDPQADGKKKSDIKATEGKVVSPSK